jgi:hypothetical protein
MATIERHSDQRSLGSGSRPRPRQAPRDPASPWISTDLCLPVGEVLVLAGDRYAVAVLLRGGDDTADRGVFMDARNCDFLPWPSHWMPLPEAERLSPSAMAMPACPRDGRDSPRPHRR